LSSGYSNGYRVEQATFKALKPRILFLTYKLSQGGAEQQLFELVKGIDKRRFDVTVGCLVAGGEKWEEFASLNEVGVVCFQRKHRFDFSFLGRIVAYLQSYRIDILHAYIAPVTFFGTLAGLLSKTPCLIVGQRGRATFSTCGSLLYHILENLISHFADLVIANSNAGKRSRMRWGVREDKIIVVPNGLNPERLVNDVVRSKEDFGISSRCLLIGNVARMVPIKDHATLLSALKHVQRQFPTVKCALVGDGPLRTELERSIRQIGLESTVLLIGQEPKVNQIIPLFDIAVVSSKFESCCNFILEAMYCGKPVVATDVGGNPELIEHGVTGLLVPKEDPKALANALGTLIANPILRSSLGAAGKTRIEDDHRLNRMITTTENIYRDLFLRKQGNASRWKDDRHKRCTTGRR
jgi:glycosyltransferase involved in cell wall biosynthesis